MTGRLSLREVAAVPLYVVVVAIYLVAAIVGVCADIVAGYPISSRWLSIASVRYLSQAMRVTATFSKGMGDLLAGRAIGDEFAVTARARIVGADEALVEVTNYGDSDSSFLPSELEVRILLSHPDARFPDGWPVPAEELAVSPLVAAAQDLLCDYRDDHDWARWARERLEIALHQELGCPVFRSDCDRCRADLDRAALEASR